MMLDEVRIFISDLKISDLKSDELIVALTQLKELLDDTFTLLKFRKINHLPMILPDNR